MILVGGSMENTINTVLEINRKIIELVDQVVYYFRQQNYDRGLRHFFLIIDRMEQLLQLYPNGVCRMSGYNDNLDQNILLQFLPMITEAQETRDYTLLADLLELQIRPFVVQLQSIVMSEMNGIPTDYFQQRNMQALRSNIELWEELNKSMEVSSQESKNYVCEYTTSGYITVQCTRDGKIFYLHSNNNPQAEGMILANTWYSEEKYHYVVYGLGLGYHIKQLCACNPYITVDVYEDSMEMIKLAAKYGDLYDWVQSGQVQIYWDPDYTRFAKQIERVDETTELVIYAPSLRLVRDKRVQKKMEEYFLHYHSIKNQFGIMMGNFRYNTTHYDASVDVLASKWKGKDVYIIAAGPSLDHNYEELRKIGENGIILATATVYRKLVKAGIRPDYFIVTDANARIIGQMEGVEQETIPMLMLTTAYNGFARICKGTKYLVCQEDFTSAEDFARKHGYHLYQSGGSVTTAALDLAIQLQASRIIFVGLDLAYPNNLVHAAGTSRRNLHEDQELIQIKDINGNLIKTNKHLDLYRRWIEERIQNENAIEFYDATEGGARVKGTTICKLSDLVNAYPENVR